MASLFIKISIRWKWEPGEGLVCCNCGDMCWLKQLRLVMVVEKKDEPQDLVLCHSCGSILFPEI